MSLPREVLKWVLSLDLSYPVKNPRRDFCNGFLYAEILSRYFPNDVHMHSYENVSSVERKKQNWSLLEKFFKKKKIPVERQNIDGVIAAAAKAAVEVLTVIFDYIHGPAYQVWDYDNNVPKEEFYPQQPAVSYAQQQQALYFNGYNGGNKMAPTSQGPYQLPQAMPSPQPIFMPLSPQQQHPGMVMNPFLMQHQQMILYQKQQLQQLQQQRLFSGAAMYMGMGMPGQFQPMYPVQQLPQQPSTVPKPAPADSSANKPPAPGRGSSLNVKPAAAPHHKRRSTDQLDVVVEPKFSVSNGSPELIAVGKTDGYAAAGVVQPNQAMPPNGYLNRPAFMQPQGQRGHLKPQLQNLQLALAQQQAEFAQQQQTMIANQLEELGKDISKQKDKSDEAGIAYSRKPRRIENFTPYSQKDFEEKGYAKNQDKNYWELGVLGPDLETEELQSKREKQDKIKQLAARVREDNLKKAQHAASADELAAKREKDKEPSKRDRALQFAKNVPKPEPPKPKAPPVEEEAAWPAKKSVHPRSALEAPVLTELERLEAQHKADRERVEAIRQELARLL